ncbi:MAG TPA: SH3 domain-containing protein [Ramlibacter sp.]|nr:SH3 domain-containing protein [Ramlibacter sp.]
MMIRTAMHSVGRAGLRAGLVLALASPLAWAQGEAAVTRRAAELRENPGDVGRSVASLPAQSPLTRLGDRQGPWVRVRTEAGATGWLHLFDVGPPGSSSGGGNIASGALRSVTGLFTGSRATSSYSPTTTVGIRGLSAEDLARAQPNTAAVGQMETLRQSDAQARAFASAAALQPVAVEPLPAPPRPATGVGGHDPSNPPAQ